MSKSVKISNHVEIGSGKPLTLIAGPCVIESYDLCYEVANQASKICSQLGIQFIFKSSFDKANRTSSSSFRGFGLDQGLSVLEKIKHQLNIPVTTDIHESWQPKEISSVVDLMQIPAFLCRQTDLLQAAAESGKPVNVKKGQFLAPWDMENVVKKLTSFGCEEILLTERGASFGYNALVVDFRSLPIMKKMGYPVVFDATHSVQIPGGLGNKSSGQREFVLPLAKAAVAVGIDALFMEVHPNPDEALSDGPNMIKLDDMEAYLKILVSIHNLSKEG
ncbi:3-deoxy-8-phosphooctulonate synthase [Planktothrix sp.]|uniref:3-deoxy-8-phosphooctulonate synthase n=1 Tax=Planktothrix sp. TaxID=3088171 RepID=UPI0038D40BE3